MHIFTVVAAFSVFSRNGCGRLSAKLGGRKREPRLTKSESGLSLFFFVSKRRFAAIGTSGKSVRIGRKYMFSGYGEGAPTEDGRKNGDRCP